MKKSPYHGFKNNELLLRDILAMDRTALANERTFLAYLRTAIAFLIAGISALKFFDSGLVFAMGWPFVIFGILLFTTGIIRCRKIKKNLNIIDAHKNSDC